MLDTAAPWYLNELEFTETESKADRAWLWERLSETPRKIRSYVVRYGLNVGRTCGEIEVFDHATAAINEVPDLALIVRARVNHIHALEAPPEYDISHSEPKWEDRIFVSVPERSDGIAALRLAESVIHEAMHLHLTLFEHGSPLVHDAMGEIHSPWRGAPRPFLGVLHGLFVFACLHEYFARLSLDREPAATRHIDRRLTEIKNEIAQIDIGGLSLGLTAVGKSLAARPWNQTMDQPLPSQ
jgi:HEXXH motif-containing protein